MLESGVPADGIDDADWLSWSAGDREHILDRHQQGEQRVQEEQIEQLRGQLSALATGAMQGKWPQAAASRAIPDPDRSCCRHCGTLLQGEDLAPLRHQVIEIPPITPLVIEHLRPVAGGCGSQPLGPGLTALIGLLGRAFPLSTARSRRCSISCWGCRSAVRPWPPSVSGSPQRWSSSYRRPLLLTASNWWSSASGASSSSCLISGTATRTARSQGSPCRRSWSWLPARRANAVGQNARHLPEVAPGGRCRRGFHAVGLPSSFRHPIGRGDLPTRPIPAAVAIRACSLRRPTPAPAPPPAAAGPG